VVSAITHTPASGPFELRTTPPMSSLSMATAAACCALAGAGTPAAKAAIPIAATVEYSACLSLISILPADFGFTARCRGELIRHWPDRSRIDVNGINSLDRLEARHEVWTLRRADELLVRFAFASVALCSPKPADVP
jgi:hypothetical protein